MAITKIQSENEQMIRSSNGADFASAAGFCVSVYFGRFETEVSLPIRELSSLLQKASNTMLIDRAMQRGFALPREIHLSLGGGDSELPRKGQTWTLLITLRNAVSLGCEKVPKDEKERK